MWIMFSLDPGIQNLKQVPHVIQTDTNTRITCLLYVKCVAMDVKITQKEHVFFVVVVNYSLNSNICQTCVSTDSNYISDRYPPPVKHSGVEQDCNSSFKTVTNILLDNGRCGQPKRHLIQALWKLFLRICRESVLTDPGKRRTLQRKMCIHGDNYFITAPYRGCKGTFIRKATKCSSLILTLTQK